MTFPIVNTNGCSFSVTVGLGAGTTAAIIVICIVMMVSITAAVYSRLFAGDSLQYWPQYYTTILLLKPLPILRCLYAMDICTVDCITDEKV